MNNKRFAKMFLSDIGLLYKISGNGVKLLISLASKMAISNQIIATGEIKNKLALELGITKRTIDNLFTELVKSSLIIKQASNVYLMNPYIFGKGDEMSVDLKRVNFMKIKYSKEGRTIELGLD